MALSGAMSGLAALTNNQGGLAVSTTTPIGPWAYMYGQQKVGGVEIFRQSNNNTGGSSTSNWKQLHRVYALACHPCIGDQNGGSVPFQLRIDGKQVLLNSCNPNPGWQSYSPTQIMQSITSMSRNSNGLVTFQIAGGIAGLNGQEIQITESSDNTLNGIWIVTQPNPADNTTFTFVSGGTPTPSGTNPGGQCWTLYADYKDKIHIEFLQRQSHQHVPHGLLAAGTNWKAQPIFARTVWSMCKWVGTPAYSRPRFLQPVVRDVRQEQYLRPANQQLRLYQQRRAVHRRFHEPACHTRRIRPHYRARTFPPAVDRRRRTSAMNRFLACWWNHLALHVRHLLPVEPRPRNDPAAIALVLRGPVELPGRSVQHLSRRVGCAHAATHRFGHHRHVQVEDAPFDPGYLQRRQRCLRLAGERLSAGGLSAVHAGPHPRLRLQPRTAAGLPGRPVASWKTTGERIFKRTCICLAPSLRQLRSVSPRSNCCGSASSGAEPSAAP